MTATRRFQRTLSAVKRAGATQGQIGSALRADIHATGGAAGDHADRAVNNFKECASFLEVVGYTFSEEYLQGLYRLAAIQPRARDRIE